MCVGSERQNLAASLQIEVTRIKHFLDPQSKSCAWDTFVFVGNTAIWRAGCLFHLLVLGAWKAATPPLCLAEICPSSLSHPSNPSSPSLDYRQATISDEVPSCFILPCASTSDYFVLSCLSSTYSALSNWIHSTLLKASKSYAHSQLLSLNVAEYYIESLQEGPLGAGTPSASKMGRQPIFGNTGASNIQAHWGTPTR